MQSEAVGILKKLLKGVLWIVGVSIGLALAGYLVVLGINLQGTTPSESVARLEEFSASIEQIGDDQNAYVYLTGFSIERGEDPREWGKKRIAWAQQLLEQPYEDSYFEAPGKEFDIRKQNDSVINELLDSCKEAGCTCLELMEKNEKHILNWINANGWLLERYQALLNHPAWYETVSYDIRLPLPNYTDVLDAQMLLYANAWVAAGESDTATVKRLLERDIRFWRQVLASSDILITKMIAVAALKRHFSWANAILRRLPSNKVMAATPESWSLPISEQERSLLRCLIGEWKFFNGMIGQVKEGHISTLEYEEDITIVDRAAWYLAIPMLKPQEESNRFAELIQRTVDVLQVPYEEYPQAVERARAFLEESKQSAFPSRAYNITGDYLFSTVGWHMSSYSVRVVDLEGIRRIAVAATDLRSRAIPKQQISGELPNIDIRNPYTGEPLLWDQEQGAIVFQGLEPGERGRHVVLY
jgi:hypothetical protein